MLNKSCEVLYLPLEEKNKRLTPKQFITKWYARVFEKEHPIYNALKQIEKETGLKFEGRNNAYEMAVLTRGTVARAATFIKRETFNSVTGERTGESLESILKDVDDVESFGRYLVARHGLYLIEKKENQNTIKSRLDEAVFRVWQSIRSTS